MNKSDLLGERSEREGAASAASAPAATPWDLFAGKRRPAASSRRLSFATLCFTPSREAKKRPGRDPAGPVSNFALAHIYHGKSPVRSSSADKAVGKVLAMGPER